MALFRAPRRMWLPERPPEDFDSRFLANPHSEGLIRESGHWQWVGSHLRPGETRRVRAKVRFDGLRGADARGFVFLTDQHIFFCPGTRTDRFAIRDVTLVAGLADRAGLQVATADGAGGQVGVAMTPIGDQRDLANLTVALVHAVREIGRNSRP